MSNDTDIFSTKYDISNFDLYPLGKDDDQEYRIDLRGMCNECTLYENIYSPFLEFHTNAVDTLGILRNLPLRGGELLRLRFKIHTSKDPVIRTYAFRLVTFSKKTIRDGMELYQPLIFMSKQFFYNQSLRVNWAYPKGTKFKDIVKEMLDMLKIEEEKKTFSSHETNGLGNTSGNQMCFTNITPLECIYRLIPFTSVSDNNKLCDFLFFESLDKNNKISFKYKSLYKLMQEAKQEYNKDSSWKFQFFPLQNSHVRSMFGDKELIAVMRDKKIIPISKYDVEDNKNNIQGLENALSGGSTYHLDILTKSFRRTEMNVENLFKSIARYNQTPWVVADKLKHFFAVPSDFNKIQQTLQQFNMFKMVNHNIFDRDTRDPNTDLIRKFNFNSIDQYSINLLSPGHTDIYIGTMTQFLLQELNVKGENRISISYETQLKYLISAIKHVFTGNDYHMIIHLTADGEVTSDIFDRYEQDKKEWVKKTGEHLRGTDQSYIPGLGFNDKN